MPLEDKCRRIKHETPSFNIKGNSFNAFGQTLPLAQLKRVMAYPIPPKPTMRLKKFRNKKLSNERLIYFIWGEYMEGVKHKPVVRYVGVSINPKTRLGSGHHAVMQMEMSLKQHVLELNEAMQHYPEGHNERNVIAGKIHFLKNEISNNPLISVLYERELPTPIHVAEAYYIAECYPSNILNTETKKSIASLEAHGNMPDDLNLLAADQLMDFPKRKINEN
jgi:hypothetical protein|tara:strand:+ start:270 stop:932 length:663 start_codon:yes stop_codon:yes gene_type:complete